VLDLLGAGLMALGLRFGEPRVLKPIDLSTRLNITAEFAVLSDKATALIAQQPDPQAELIVRQYLQNLANQGMSVSNQGIWLQIGKYPILIHQGNVPLPAASLTKVATTLAALDTWGPDYQFETLITATGPIENGVLQGDLVVRSDGDPFFVWEEAIALGNALTQAGIKRVTGNLLVTPAFSMNFEADPRLSGTLLQEALNAQTWSEDAEYQYGFLPPNTPKPQIVIDGEVEVIAPTDARLSSSTLVVRHQSLPMTAILKSMNIYSNNEMSERLAQLLGGHQTVAAKAAAIAGIPPGEIQLINGSGLGVENRISPRASVAMFVAIQEYLQSQNLTVADLFPVAGRDGGTLDYRNIPIAAAVKTGTLNTVSALAGAFPTRDRGVVWFSIQNQGADIEGLRAQQDALLQALTQHWGVALPLPEAIKPNILATDQAQLGDASRNQIL
jgi:D-alanyl-D-alanine carboxypeptidase/D-alanyl-D-alanine-endopeptidase (penicillin-binding protein 4)